MNIIPLASNRQETTLSLTALPSTIHPGNHAVSPVSSVRNTALPDASLLQSLFNGRRPNVVVIHTKEKESPKEETDEELIKGYTGNSLTELEVWQKKVSDRVTTLRNDAQKNLPWARRKLCDFTTIKKNYPKEKLYDALRSVIIKDSINKATSEGTLDIVRDLNSALEAVDVDGITTEAQTMLLRTYSVAIEVHLLHCIHGSFGAVRSDAKTRLITAQNNFAKLNVTRNKAIEFCHQRAFAATKKLHETDTTFDKFTTRALHFAKALGNAYNKDIGGFASELKQTFEGMSAELRSEWYEIFLGVRKEVKSTNNPMKNIECLLMLIRTEIKKSDWKLTYGALELLEETISETDDVNVLELTLFGRKAKIDASSAAGISREVSTLAEAGAKSVASDLPGMLDLMCSELPAIRVKSGELYHTLKEKLYQTNEGTKLIFSRYNIAQDPKDPRRLFVKDLCQNAPRMKSGTTLKPKKTEGLPKPSVANPKPNSGKEEEQKRTIAEVSRMKLPPLPTLIAPKEEMANRSFARLLQTENWQFPFPLSKNGKRLQTLANQVTRITIPADAYKYLDRLERIVTELPKLDTLTVKYVAIPKPPGTQVKKDNQQLVDFYRHSLQHHKQLQHLNFEAGVTLSQLQAAAQGHSLESLSIVGLDRQNRGYEYYKRVAQLSHEIELPFWKKVFICKFSSREERIQAANKSFDNWLATSEYAPKATDKDSGKTLVETITQSRGLKKLRIEGAQLTDHELMAMCHSCNSIEELCVAGNPLSRDSLPSITELPNLTSLDISGMQKLRSTDLNLLLKCHLSKLNLTSCFATIPDGVMVPVLTKMRTLGELDMSEIPLFPQDIRDFAGFQGTNLKVLRIARTEQSPCSNFNSLEFRKSIKAILSLRELDMRGYAITPDDFFDIIDTLKNLTSLHCGGWWTAEQPQILPNQYVEMEQVRLDPEFTTMIKFFKKARPNLKIVFAPNMTWKVYSKRENYVPDFNLPDLFS